MNSILVGDPVDVMTGVQFDIALDYRITWSFPFEWRRFYSTARLGEHLALGWGHTHSYDHRLRFDVHGVTYTEPSGRMHSFDIPTRDGQSTTLPNATLRRVARSVLHVKARGQPTCEFTFRDATAPARLLRVRRGRDAHELNYDEAGRWVGVSFQGVPPIRVETDGDGRVRALVWVDAAQGHDRVLWEGQYDTNGDLTAVVDVHRTVQRFTYDAAHRMVERRDRSGYGFVATFDSSGRCEYSSGEDGVQAVRLRYAEAGGATVVTRADGGEWQYLHGDLGVTQIVDPYGGVTRRVFDEARRLAQEIGPEGETLLAQDDPESGLLRPPVVPAGMAMPFGDPWFEALRRRHTPSDALGWDGGGELLERSFIRLPRRDAEWTRRLPVTALRAIRFADRAAEASPLQPRAVRPSHEPGAKKPFIRISAPGELRYDAFGDLLSHTLPTGETCRWQYDANGNVARYVDYLGSAWITEHASWNLLVRRVDPLGYATTITYTPLEQVSQVRDAGGCETVQMYDLKERLTERHRHGERRDAFRYDRSAGIVAALASRGEQRVTMAHGPYARPVLVHPTGTAPRTCIYDDHGRLTAVTGADTPALEFAYDEGGRLTLDMQAGRGCTRRYARMRLTETGVLHAFVTRYAMDDAGHSTIVDPLGGRHTVHRLDSGVFSRRFANGDEELLQYDWNGQCVARARIGRGSVRTLTHAYRYSPVGTLLTAIESEFGTWTYQYDAAHRLRGAVGPNGAKLRFSFDSAGNLVSGPGLEGVRTWENRLVAANGRRFEYSARHHLVRDSGLGVDRLYEYDAEDHLVTCIMGSERVDFVYDALGRRLEKRSSKGSTQFVWDGERLAAEIATDGKLRVYLYLDAKALTPFAFIDYDGVDADPTSGFRRYVFADQVGRPVCVQDDDGHTLWRARLDPYCRIEVDPESQLVLNLRWPGHYYDVETGLHYNRHRYYSPELCRYIQVDPRDIDGGLNVYAYSSRPLDEVDLDGLAPCPKKPMISPAPDSEEFRAAKAEADRVEKEMRDAIATAVKNGEMHPLDAAGVTMAAMVIVRKDPAGSFEVVVSANRNPEGLPIRVQEAMGDNRVIGHGDDRPPPIRQGDEDWRYSRENPRTGNEEPSTHNHAEQRALRSADCDPDTQGVAYVAPTRPCCQGCSSAIQTSPENGGWGGDDSNVSDHGRSGPHW